MSQCKQNVRKSWKCPIQFHRNQVNDLFYPFNCKIPKDNQNTVKHQTITSKFLAFLPDGKCRRVQSDACGQREKGNKYLDAPVDRGAHLLTRIQTNQLHTPPHSCVFTFLNCEQVFIYSTGLRRILEAVCVRM